MASYTTLLQALSTLPSTIHSAFNIVVAVIMTITPSVIISLAYRVFVMYASARIIPAVRDSGARTLSQEPTMEDDDEAGRLLGFLTWFSPSILIAVYTSLLMQHFASNIDSRSGEWWKSQGGDSGGNLWRWINIAVTMALYAIELHMSRDHDEGRLTSHWKSDWSLAKIESEKLSISFEASPNAEYSETCFIRKCEPKLRSIILSVCCAQYFFDFAQFAIRLVGCHNHQYWAGLARYLLKASNNWIKGIMCELRVFEGRDILCVWK